MAEIVALVEAEERGRIANAAPHKIRCLPVSTRVGASLLTINKIDANSIGEGDEIRVKRDICEQILGSSRWGKIRCRDAIAEKHQGEGPIVLS